MRRRALLRAVLTYLVVSGLCWVAIRVFAPTPASVLSGPTELASGVVAHASFTGEPHGLALLISLSVGLTAMLLWRMVAIFGRYGVRSLRQLPRAQAGQAITEFVIVFWALIMTVTGVAQMSLMYNAKQVALYSAFAAARSAIVWIPQDVEGEDPPNQITLSTGYEKYGNIKSSAALACVPIAQSATDVLGNLPVIGPVVNDVMNAINSALAVIPGLNQAVDYADKFAYAYALTTVSFVNQGPGGITEIGSPGSVLTFNQHEDITIEIEHCLFLPIPVAGHVVDMLDTLPPEFAIMEALEDPYTHVNSTCTLTLENP